MCRHLWYIQRTGDYMPDLNLLHIFFLIVIGIGAGLIQRVCGFGIGMFSMLFMPHFLPSYTGALSCCSSVSSVQSAYNAARFRKKIPYRVVLPALLGASVTIPLAVYFSSKIPQGSLKKLLGVVLVCLSVYFLFVSSRLKMKPSFRNGLLAGTVGGILNGFFAAGAPPVVMFFSSTTDDKDTYFAATQFYFFFTNVYSTVSRIVAGMMGWNVAVYALISIVGSLIGTRIGGSLVNRIDSKTLKTVIYCAMAFSGILMIH